MTDKELVSKIIDGDEQAFKQLVEQYQALVINTCYGFLHTREDAEDIAQDVFIEAYKSIAQFRFEAKLSTWLYRIAVNKCLNFLRDNKYLNLFKKISAFAGFGDEKSDYYSESDKKDEIANLPDSGQQPDIVLEQEERRKILHQAIESLSMNQKIAFTLHKYEDLSYKEIAEIMNISLSSVESLIHRAKKNIQKRLLRYYKVI